MITYFKQKPGRKLVKDETIGKFRDEHSGPFSTSTRSQLNLRVCELDPEVEEPPSVDYNKILSQKLAQEAVKRAAIKSPLNKNHHTKDNNSIGSKEKKEATIEQIDSKISYNKIKNDEQVADVDGNFISKFINRLSVNATQNPPNGNTFDTDEHENLVSGINLSFSTQHSEDSEEEMHHTEKSLEFKSLLDDKDGFDFLNNW